MPLGRIRHLQAMAGRIYHLLTKEASYGPNVHHLDDFRAAQAMEKSLYPDQLAREDPGSARNETGELPRDDVSCLRH
jgi:hypothetical protein